MIVPCGVTEQSCLTHAIFMHHKFKTHGISFLLFIQLSGHTKAVRTELNKFINFQFILGLKQASKQKILKKHRSSI